MIAEKIRMDLHAIPEIGYCEFETKKYILSFLQNLGCKIFEVEDTGVVAFFDFGKSEAVAIRADMDALPIEEQTNLSFKSRHKGFMHACGHDGHMAMALAAAKYVNDTKNFSKNVVFVFQPAEELDGGARHIIDSGIFKKFNITSIFGIHLWPDLPKGKVYSKSGAIMAKASETDITVSGMACHVADGEKGIDALMSAAELLTKIRKIETLANEKEKCVLKFGKMSAGSLRNIVCDKAEINGTMRVLSMDMFEFLKGELLSAAYEVEKQFGCKIDVNIKDGFPPVINDKTLFEKVQKTCQINLLEKPVMQAEDFSFYGKVCPSVFFFLGLGEGMKLHSEKFDFDMSVLNVGVELYKKLLTL